jgi:parallel beta-helix repeat protein
MIGDRMAALILLLILCSVLVAFPNVEIVKAESTVYIRADGTVEGTDKILRDGNLYTFTDNIYSSIVVEKDDVIIDGEGYTLQGNGSGYGIQLIHRSHVTIRNMAIKKFDTGIHAFGSRNNNISANYIAHNEGNGISLDSGVNTLFGNTITNNGANGVLLYFSNYNTIRGNNITENYRGIDIYGSQYNSISGNSVANNSLGLWFFGSYSNYLLGNNITDNQVSIDFQMDSSSNRIYYNNFVNNEVHFEDTSVNFWDNGTVGNYWSDYKGTDWDRDGIGDTPYIIDENNGDNHPMMKPVPALTAPITIFNAGTWEEEKYNVNVVSNFTVSEFSFDPEGTRIRFNVMGETGTTGFCRVTIPKELLYADETEWAVLVDGNPVTPSVNEDENSAYIYFTYSQNTKTVEIIGTDAIPEFPSWIVLPLVIATILLILIYKKDLPKKHQNQKKSFILGA